MTRLQKRRSTSNHYWSIIALLAAATASNSQPTPDNGTVLEAMKKAATFMMDTVSTNGGFVSIYREDLSERWGEIPARESMIWVQDPGTVGVGRIMLEIYQKTGDEDFLLFAERTANALVWGQHPSGGWHYFIDFDPTGIERYYEEVASKCWGWEEFYHYYGNCTFDDNTTIGAADYLLDIYTQTKDPKYRGPVLKALEFVLDSQYPEGGWPQRYSLRYDHSGQDRPDYTSFHTFNDSVIAGNITFLLKAHRALGNKAYLRAARRGMQFVVVSQLGTPQAGWAQQYDMDLQPGAARNFEPKSIAPSTTTANIRNLMRYYKTTGDRRYLRGIPDALDWLDREKLPPGHSDEGHTHAQFVEIGTGRPLYAHREGTSMEEGRYWVDYEPGNFPGHYGMQLRIDVEALRAEFERVSALTPKEATAEYKAGQAETPAARTAPKVVTEILNAQDARGAWIEDVDVPDYSDWKYRPRTSFRGIRTRTFTRNMAQLLHYLPDESRP